MKKNLFLFMAILASLSCGFDWTFGLAGKCSQAKKIVAGFGEKNDAEREQLEKRVLELCPNGPAGSFVKATRFERASKPDDAMASYRECLKEDPTFPRAHGNLGWIYFQKGMLDDAALELTKALAETNDPRYHKGLARIYAEKKIYTLATYHYNEAIKGLPGDASLHAGLADVYRKQGQHDQAGEEYQKADRRQCGQ